MHVFSCALFSHGNWHVCVNGHGTCTAVHICRWHSYTHKHLYQPYNYLTVCGTTTQCFTLLCMVISSISAVHTCYLDASKLLHMTGYQFQTRSSTQCLNANAQYSPVRTHPSDGNIYKYKPHSFRLHTPLPALLYFWPEVHNYEPMHKDQWTIWQLIYI